ncbi:MAG TPA: biotin/lipoyl-containing protein, partial [Chloroflexota bacterium]
MTTTIVMPQLGESVAEGVIGKWLKNEGDTIQRDEPIVEVITDKVNAEIPSPVAGVIEKITQPEGATVAVGQEIAIIGDGEGRKSAPSPATAAAADQGSSSAAPEDGNGREPAGGVAVAAEPSRAGNAARVDRVRSSPLVRRLAEQFSINLAEVTGTGIGGRVSKQDILSFVE